MKRMAILNDFLSSFPTPFANQSEIIQSFKQFVKTKRGSKIVSWGFILQWPVISLYELFIVYPSYHNNSFDGWAFDWLLAFLSLLSLMAFTHRYKVNTTDTSILNLKRTTTCLEVEKLNENAEVTNTIDEKTNGAFSKSENADLMMFVTKGDDFHNINSRVSAFEKTCNNMKIQDKIEKPEAPSMKIETEGEEKKYIVQDEDVMFEIKKTCKNVNTDNKLSDHNLHNEKGFVVNEGTEGDNVYTESEKIDRVEDDDVKNEDISVDNEGSATISDEDLSESFAFVGVDNENLENVYIAGEELARSVESKAETEIAKEAREDYESTNIDRRKAEPEQICRIKNETPNGTDEDESFSDSEKDNIKNSEAKKMDGEHRYADWMSSESTTSMNTEFEEIKGNHFDKDIPESIKQMEMDKAFDISSKKEIGEFSEAIGVQKIEDTNTTVKDEDKKDKAGAIASSSFNSAWWYCDKCETQSPARAHHCSICGVCVLKHNHHCFLSGCCVGHRNHRHFVGMMVYLAVLTVFLDVYNWPLVTKVFGALSWSTILAPHFGYLSGDCTLYDILVIVFTLILTSDTILVLFILFADNVHIRNGQTLYEYKHKIGDYQTDFKSEFNDVFGSAGWRLFLNPFCSTTLPSDGSYFAKRNDADKKTK